MSLDAGPGPGQEVTTNGSNGDHLRKRIAVVGTGPVALFLAYCLAQSTMNEVIIVGRAQSNTTKTLIENGYISINTKTIRDLHAMLDGTYQATEDDPDISIELGDGRRAIQTGRLLIDKFEKMGTFGNVAAAAIEDDGRQHLTKEDLLAFEDKYFKMSLTSFQKGVGNIGVEFDQVSQTAKSVLATTDAYELGGTCDLVIMAVKALEINQDLAENRVWPMLKKDIGKVVVAANGINPTLVPPMHGRIARSDQEAVDKITQALAGIEALEDSSAFCRIIREAGHDVLGAAITFALNTGERPSDLVFSSKIHEAKLTVPDDEVLKKAFNSGTKLLVDFKEGLEYTRDVLKKLAVNQMNGITAALQRTKANVIEHKRFRPFYVNIVREMHQTFAALGLQITQDASALVRSCTDYHQKSAADGGHVSSTYMDFLRGKSTEVPFIHYALEQMADFAAASTAPEGEIGIAQVPNIRILRRSLRALEKHLVENPNPSREPQDVWQEIAAKLRNSIVVLDKTGNTSQMRWGDGKAEVNESGVFTNVRDDEGHRKSGIFWRLVEAYAYRHGMNRDKARELVAERIDKNSFHGLFEEQLLATYYDDVTGRVDKSFFTDFGELLTGKGLNPDDMADYYEARMDQVHQHPGNGNGGGGGVASITCSPDADFPRSAANDDGLTPIERRFGGSFEFDPF